MLSEYGRTATAAAWIKKNRARNCSVVAITEICGVDRKLGLQHVFCTVMDLKQKMGVYMKICNRRTEFILILLCLTECILIGIIRTVYMLDGFTVALLPVGMFMVLLFNDSFHIHVTRKLLIPCIILSILFFVMLSIE